MKVPLIVIGLCVLISLVPSASRTVGLASDGYGLVTLAVLKGEEFSANPYDANGYLLSPAAAVWMMKTFDYPYGRCSHLSEKIDICGAPLVAWQGRMLNSIDDGQRSEGGALAAEVDRAEQRAYSLLAVLIARGESVDAPLDGFTPLHQAVLFNNPKYFKLLLAAGADLQARLDTPDTDYHDLTVAQYIRFLEAKGLNDLSELKRLAD